MLRYFTETSKGCEGSNVPISASNTVFVESKEDLSGDLDSSKFYLITRVVDMEDTSIIIPEGGLSLGGYTFDISKLISSSNNFTLFISPVAGSGNLLGADFSIEITGTDSKVYDIKSRTGNEAIELYTVNYNNCTSLGVVDNFRQGLEVGTGRFGGKPSLTLEGYWRGGFFFDTSIVRSLDSSMSEPLFKAGTNFLMESRFRTNMNVDLPANASILDFSPSNFSNPSTLQFVNLIATRQGSSNPDDSNMTPNISHSDLPSFFVECEGITNTFVGGRLTVGSVIETVINTASVFTDLLGNYLSSDLQHFDSPSSGRLRHLGNSPRDFEMYANIMIDGVPNNIISLKVVKWDNSLSTFVDVIVQTQQVNSLLGFKDVAFFNILTPLKLDQDDYIFLQVANDSGVSNITATLDSYIYLSQR